MNIASDINTYRACLLLFSLTLSMSCGCGDETDDCPEFEATEATIEVMPIGDSRVEGARPEFESYRYELWKNLKQDNWDVDFIGARFDPASYPEFGGTCFDNEHEGTGGAQTPDILDTLNRETYPRPPEVALLGIGGNDLLNSTGRPVEEVVSNVESIIARLRELNPNVIILMEQIAPGKSDFMSEEQTNRFDTYNVQIGELGAALNTETSPVVVVDMTPGWQDGYLADPVHYNEAGAKVVADRYYEAWQQVVTR